MMKGRANTKPNSSPYISPRELAARWCCARSTVLRIADRAGLTRLYLGTGKNGIVRYLREEVIAYELTRQVKPDRKPAAI